MKTNSKTILMLVVSIFRRMQPSKQNSGSKRRP